MKKILVISSYPEKGKTHGEKTVGVASYTKNTLLGINKAAHNNHERLSIRVLAEKLDDESEKYIEHGIQIERIWKRNNLLSFILLLKEVMSSPAQYVFLAHEFAVFGGILTVILFPLLLLAIRISGKKGILISHHVLTDVPSIAGHMNIDRHSFSEKIGTLAMHIFYRSVTLFAHNIVVFDETLKEKMSQFGYSEKISTIPHGVENVHPTISKSAARKKLQIRKDEFVLVSFGYLAWYKGTDWMIRTISQHKKKLQNKKIRLIIAGGPNKNRLDYAFYKNYCKGLNKIVQKNNNITITGYVPQKDIELYYQAADCIVFPYRTVFSASGPLSLAFSYKKPFIMSDSMEEIANTPDMQRVLLQNNITAKDIIFSLSSSSFENRLESIIIDRKKVKRIQDVSCSMRNIRSFESVGYQYLNLLIPPYDASFGYSQRPKWSIPLAQNSTV